MDMQFLIALLGTTLSCFTTLCTLENSKYQQNNFKEVETMRVFTTKLISRLLKKSEKRTISATVKLLAKDEAYDAYFIAACKQAGMFKHMPEDALLDHLKAQPATSKEVNV